MQVKKKKTKQKVHEERTQSWLALAELEYTKQSK